MDCGTVGLVYAIGASISAGAGLRLRQRQAASGSPFTAKWFHKFSTVILLCGVSVTLAATAEEDYLAASSKWKAAGLKDYQYSVSNSLTLVTGCGVELPARLTVRAGTVVSGVYIYATGMQVSRAPIPTACLHNFLTIDSLFNDIARLLGHCDGLQVTYDAHYGYPRSIGTRCILDGQYPVTVWDVTPEKK